MSGQHGIQVRVFSPRWGHADSYTILFSHEAMEVKGVGAKAARCRIDEHGILDWSGHGGSENPFLNMLADDHIHPPVVFISALEWAWEAWRKGEIQDEDLTSGLEELFEWVNATTEARPKSDFWRRCF